MREGRAACAPRHKRGPFSFTKENGPLLIPQEKGIRLAVSDLNDSYASGMGMPARGGAAFSVAIRLASASIIRCRSAHLVGVQPNSRLPPASSMRRAQQCRYFARSLPPSKRHSRLTIVRRGCWMCRIAGIHGEAMYTALTLRSACSSSRSRLPMCGVEGEGPSSFLLGDLKGDILFLRKRISPFNALPHGAGAPPPRSARRYTRFPYMKRSHLSMPLYNLRFLSAKRP